MLSIYVWLQTPLLYKADSEVNLVCFQSFVFVRFPFCLKEEGSVGYFILTLGCIQFCAVSDTWVTLPAYLFLCTYSKWVLHGN